MVEHFNNSNKWKKRGISCVPITYEVGLRPIPGKVSIMNDGSIAVEVGGIEIGQGLWTKVKQMTTFGLGQLCRDGGECLLHKGSVQLLVKPLMLIYTADLLEEKNNVP